MSPDYYIAFILLFGMACNGDSPPACKLYDEINENGVCKLTARTTCNPGDTIKTCMSGAACIDNVCTCVNGTVAGTDKLCGLQYGDPCGPGRLRCEVRLQCIGSSCLCPALTVRNTGNSCKPNGYVVCDSSTRPRNCSCKPGFKVNTITNQCECGAGSKIVTVGNPSTQRCVKLLSSPCNSSTDYFITGAGCRDGTTTCVQASFKGSTTCIGYLGSVLNSSTNLYSCSSKSTQDDSTRHCVCHAGTQLLYSTIGGNTMLGCVKPFGSACSVNETVECQSGFCTNGTCNCPSLSFVAGSSCWLYNYVKCVGNDCSCPAGMTPSSTDLSCVCPPDESVAQLATGIGCLKSYGSNCTEYGQCVDGVSCIDGRCQCPDFSFHLGPGYGCLEVRLATCIMTSSGFSCKCKANTFPNAGRTDCICPTPGLPYYARECPNFGKPCGLDMDCTKFVSCLGGYCACGPGEVFGGDGVGCMVGVGSACNSTDVSMKRCASGNCEDSTQTCHL